MPRLLLLLAIIAAVCVLAGPGPADAGAIGPWYVQKGVPVQPAQSSPPGAGLIGGGGVDVSGNGQFIATTGDAPDNFPGCVSDACLAYIVINTDTGETDPVGLAYDGSTILSLILIPPRISDDGRYVVFANQGIHIFDRQTRIDERVDKTTAGALANPPSYSANISGDGRHVVFVSGATNMGASAQCGSGNCSQVFVRDVDAQTTEMVSVDGGHMADGSSTGAAISYDGNFVAFDSESSNLGQGASNNGCQGNQVGQFRNCADVFVRNRSAGTTVLASPNLSGGQGNGDSRNPGISDDGNFVSFSSDAGDLVDNDTNQATDIFVRDIGGGTTERVSVTSFGVQTDNGSSTSPSISGNGQRVTFISTSTTLDPSGPALCGITNITCQDIFVHERPTHSTFKVSVSEAGDHGDARSDYAAISNDGRRIALRSGASNLAPDVPGGIFLAVRRSDFTWGDFDCSGLIDLNDVRNLLLSQVGLYAPAGACPPGGTATTVDGQNVTWADFDCVGGVTAADASPVLAYVAGAPEDLACPDIGLPAEPQSG